MYDEGKRGSSMRKIWIVSGMRLLAVFLLLNLHASWQAGGYKEEAPPPQSTYEMDTVSNSDRAIPAPVYAEPREDAAILFQYYNGSWVYVEKPPEEYLPEPWARVRIACTEKADEQQGPFLEGYMLKSQLAYQSGQRHIYDGRPFILSTGRTWKLYDEPSLESGFGQMPPGMDGALHGFSEEWWHVALYDGNITQGYVSIEQSAMVPYVNAWVEAGGPGQSVDLREEPTEDAGIAGSLYHGTWIQYLRAVGEEGWVEVCMGDTWNHRAYGYLKVGELVLTDNREDPYDTGGFPKAEVFAPDAAVGLAVRHGPSKTASREYALKHGQVVTVYGSFGDFSYISDGNCLCFVVSECLRPIPTSPGV